VTEEPIKAPIEFRSAEVAGVNFAQRIIELVAVPYEQEAIVEWRGELWHETFARGSFDGIQTRPNRVRVNRDHDKTRTIGKAVAFHPSRDEGLVTELKIADTPLGTETLTLANDDVLSASIEFAARMRDQILDKTRNTRRIVRAYLDAVAMVPDPAYNGAKVLSVRDDVLSPDADLPRLAETPALDELVAWMAARRH
jgi:HK97 family phage prohead protease